MTRKVSTGASDKTSVRARVVARTMTTVAKARTPARARVVARRPIAAAKARTGAHCKASSVTPNSLEIFERCRLWRKSGATHGLARVNDLRRNSHSADLAVFRGVAGV